MGGRPFAWARLVEAAPKAVLEKAAVSSKGETADKAKEALEAAGATVSLK